MYHYLVLVWSALEERATAEALRVERLIRRRPDVWQSALSLDGLSVYAQNPVDPAFDAYILPSGSGVIFGRLFAQNEMTSPVGFSDSEASRLAESGGLALLRDYWGNYVAFLHAKTSGRCHILRECSGRIPCYYTERSGVHIFFADVRDATDLGFHFNVSEKYLRRFISRQPLHIRDTGLTEVRELLAGDSVVFSRRGVDHQVLWDPRAVALRRTIDDYPRALHELRTAAERSIEAWASAYGRILLNLSGGLDSAIVLGCLKTLGMAERVVCVNHYTADSADDERHYARSAAEMAGVKLIEIPRSHSAREFVEKIGAIPPDAKPDVPNLSRAFMMDSVTRAASEFGCETVWTGQGGDHLFLYATHAFGAADYLCQHSVPRHLVAHVHAAALISRKSIWSVLLQACRGRFLPRRAPDEILAGCGAAFLAPSDTTDEDVHLPWHAGGPALVPGKQAQVDDIADVLNRHKPMPSLEVPYEHHPLLSQPLIEASLQIPTYHLLRGGRRRALAREAFADRVPASILKREDKGDTSDRERTLLRGSAPLIRERLLDGALAASGILNRKSIERILVHHEMYKLDEFYPLFCCIAAEFWLQHWKSSTRNAKARSVT